MNAPGAEQAADAPWLRISAAGADAPYLTECWRFRTVVWFLARRDVVIRYRMTAIGLAWVWLKPLLAAAVFTLVFSRIAHMPSGGMPYPLLVLIGMVPWQYFASVVHESSISLANNPQLITKIWLPRILLPLATMVSNAVDLPVNAALVAIAMAYYRVLPSWHALAAPLALLPVIMMAAGCGLWSSALMVKYRDFRNIIPMALQFGLICSPAAFSLGAAPSGWADWLWLNPLAAPIEWLRWCVFPALHHPSAAHSALSLALCAGIMASGYGYFRRNEGRFADDI